MDMYQKRKKRKENKDNNIEISSKVTNINCDRRIYVPIALKPYK